MIKMENLILTQQEKLLLDKIIHDKYAVGPFCGMIYNHYQEQRTHAGNVGNSQQLQMRLIKEALQIRILLENMATCGDGELFVPPTLEPCSDSLKDKVKSKPKTEVKAVRKEVSTSDDDDLM
tara:strand:- start:84 stop:449 length:366 start_codon:yes stop_codon:yes gene_type:complete